MMQTEPAHVFSSPSFSSYSSSETFAQIAARVIHELRLDPHYNNNLDDNLFDPWPQNDNHHPHANDNNVDANHDDDDDDFEFSFVSRTSPVSADDIFHNGQIRPTYPLFGRDVLNGVVSVPVPAADDKTATVRRRLPLRALMFEERETTTSSWSSSKDSSNELGGVAEATYCVWTPRACKKSSSARSASSRRWKLRDLLLIRSHSDGKEPIMFVGPAKRTNNKVSPKHGGSDDGGAAVKGGEQSKRKLFLPYRQELVGLFGNRNIGVGRHSQSS